MLTTGAVPGDFQPMLPPLLRLYSTPAYSASYPKLTEGGVAGEGEVVLTERAIA